MQRIALLNIVGLTPRLLGKHTPRLCAFAQSRTTAPIDTITPAVTCSVQATYLTGALPRVHGVVANGWYDRESCEIRFWKQSNKLVHAESIWETARKQDASFTCANLFWWFNMYSSADIAVTPRPMYPADGRKIPDLWTNPVSLRHELQAELGRYPLFHFWGPMAGIASSHWIAQCARAVEAKHSPTLSLVYLPHLDYNAQRLGPNEAGLADDLRAIDEVAGSLIDFYLDHGVEPIIISEYGITEVSQPVHINRALRQAGLLTVRDELGRELLDAGASRSFAVCDHQVAHVYVNDPSAMEETRRVVASLPGVDCVLDESEKRAMGLEHERAGELVALCKPDAWFTYYYWLDDVQAPDFARTVDIHRKPGYDPCELFLDPAMSAPKLKIAWKLLKKKIGMRTLMDVIPLDAGLVKGSHGRVTDSPKDGPMMILPTSAPINSDTIKATDVRDLLLRMIFS
jgi:predicted AlkP superfamily pyrophosphatase or phosphodiesterase